MLTRTGTILSALALGWLLPGQVAAHPHVFVETGLKLVLDDKGQVAGVEVSWTYDALYSMLTFEDRGLDKDYDGRLDQTELTFLAGFDLNWVEGFAGDLYLETGGTPVVLGPPEPREVMVDGEARIVSSHFRRCVSAE